MFDVVLTSDEAKVGIKYKADADWSVLGKKVRKDMGRVRNGLPKLTSQEVKDYDKTGHVSVDGIPLIAGDLKVTRYVDVTAENFSSNTDNDVVVLLDTKKYPELEVHAQRRELQNRCQQLRKSAGLQPADQVDIYYSFTGDLGEALKTIITGHEDTFLRKVGAVPRELPSGPDEMDIWKSEDNKAVGGDEEAGEEAAAGAATGYTLYVTRPARVDV